MTGIDPLTHTIERLQSSLTQTSAASTAYKEVTVQVGPDGSLRSIQLSDMGHRLSPDQLTETIIRLHALALAQARTAVNDGVAQLESDPRVIAQRGQLIDALNRPPATPAAQPQRRPSFPRAEIPNDIDDEPYDVRQIFVTG
ncbi:hypothetical protein D7D52_34995 [Nocardia yunnanensis]|uniref:YbaB/EbfC family DNA-binding protein n=1 Tax=Nocardia yunnanensis TaxID=2382165 RepID=A0A386ZNA9_9NOCA|nr:hypothetical protein [Nocardia yunnanensis]AYF78179.1 hypothetical protein D7D52_34995 [Nocardia yunnanensis]